MRFSCDPRCSMADIGLQPKSSGIESVMANDEPIVDTAPNGTVYGIELSNANEQPKRGDMGKLPVADEATGKQGEVPVSIP